MSLLRLARYVVRQMRWRWQKRPHLPFWLLALFGHPLPSAWYACFSKGIVRIPHLSVFLDASVVLLPASPLAAIVLKKNAACRGVVFWGVKEALPKADFSAIRSTTTSGLAGFFRALAAFWQKKSYSRRLAFAVSFASDNSLPVIRLEDGFLRSLDLGVRGAAPLSLVLDREGMYYDATRPSALERLLVSDWIPNDSELAKAKNAIATIIHYSISKYNQAPQVPDEFVASLAKKRVLLLDQTAGDVSIQRGCASEQSFLSMLAKAQEDHPEATLYVKTHPDVLCGKKRGLLPKEALGDKVVLLDLDVAPLSLLALFDDVYTVTSQMGFEALLLGKTVHCFGLPFYAGWGVTEDAVSCPRRTRRRSVLEIFIAAYMHYARYLSEGLESPGTIDDCLALLVTQKSLNEKNRAFHACVGFRRWKQEHARAFLASTGGSVAFFEEAETAVAEASRHSGRVVVWSAKETPTMQAACDRAGVPLLRMEDGFLRSVGLGSNFYRPGSLVLDDLGIYYDPSRPSRLECILSEERTPEELMLAKRLAGELVARGISKYNVSGASDVPKLPSDRRILLVPGQVEDDASVRLGGLGIHSNRALLEAVRSAHPDAYILYKEHPDVVSGNRLGKIDEECIGTLADGIVRTCPIERVLPLCHEVHTLTSLTGFEALLRGIPVTTYGGPFYAGWGLTSDRCSFQRRFPLPSLWHLVAGTLLLYPRYYDWNTGMFVNCQAFIEWLAKMRSSGYNFQSV